VLLHTKMHQCGQCGGKRKSAGSSGSCGWIDTRASPPRMHKWRQAIPKRSEASEQCLEAHMLPVRAIRLFSCTVCLSAFVLDRILKCEVRNRQHLKLGCKTAASIFLWICRGITSDPTVLIMDVASAAGLGLGAASLAIQLLDGVVKGRSQPCDESNSADGSL
jgi:hypothetical protein